MQTAPRAFRVRIWLTLFWSAGCRIKILRALHRTGPGRMIRAGQAGRVMRAFGFLLGAVLMASSAPAATYNVTEKSISQLQDDLTAGRVTSEELVEAYTARI